MLVERDHPWWGEKPRADVHGGVTFARTAGIAPADSDLWVIGFDCAHAGDYQPAMAALRRMLQKEAPRMRLPLREPWDMRNYRPLRYVTGEVARLVDQAIAAVDERRRAMN